MKSIEELVANLNPLEWEKQVYGYMCEQTQGLTTALLEKLDDVLMEKRNDGLTVLGFRQRWVITVFGQVLIKRRLYKDKQGNGRFLLDEAIGLDKRSPLSSGVKNLCALLACHMPFGKCEALLGLILPTGVSHTTIHRQVGKIADPAIAKEDKEVAEVFEQGKLPETGKRQVPFLFVEGDGVSIALQRENERRTELKVGIAYEGWEPIGGQGRYRLKDKTPYLGLMDGKRFWDGFSLALSKKYDLSSIKHVVVGGDGAHWVKDGAEHINGCYQLDRFHLRRELMRALKGDIEVANQVYHACIIGNVALADSLLRQEQSQWSDDDAMDIARVRAYIIDNASGLIDYRLRLEDDEVYGLRGLGAMESNNDKIAANRMKKRGMSWTRRGARRMSRLILMQLWGEVCSWTTYREQTVPAPLAKASVSTRSRVKSGKHGQVGEWLNMNLPAFSGAHSSRPWVQALKTLAHGNTSL
jgi:hypothetical protein